MKMTQAEFDKAFIGILKECTKSIFLDERGNLSELPTNRIELRDTGNRWMFDIVYTGKHRHFYVRPCSMWDSFELQHGLCDADIEQLMKNQIGLLFEMYDVPPLFQRA